MNQVIKLKGKFKEFYIQVQYRNPRVPFLFAEELIGSELLQEMVE